jgi:hypothetical protein
MSSSSAEETKSKEFESASYVMPKSGLTRTSVFIILFGALILLPVSIFISLEAGISLTGPAVYILVLLFSELGALLNYKLTKQEIFIVYAMLGIAMAGIAGVGNPVVMLVYRAFFINYPGTFAFKDPISGNALSLAMPTWWAPPYGSHAYAVRTLFQPEWVLPIVLLFLTSVVWLLQEVALTLICAHLYIEEEKLPFPFAYVDAQLITVLTETEPKMMRYLTIGTMISITYGLILYGLPLLSGGGFAPIPIPWLDLTTGLFGIENFLPGAFFALATDLSPWVTGFLIPPSITVYMVIGSLATWVFGNYFARTSFAPLFPDWANEWRKGMTANLVYQRSMLRIWIVPQIMFTIAASIILIVKGHRHYINAFKSMTKISPAMRKEGYPSLTVLLGLYFLGSFASIAIFQYFVPDFPMWLSIVVSVGFSFLNAIIATRGIGETGFALSLPYVWLGAILISGYRGVSAWLISPNIGGYSTPSWTSTLKVAKLTNTKIMDFFKAYILAFSVFMLMSLIYVDFFWRIAPMPSQQYPYINVYWPVNVMSSAMWISGNIKANLNVAFYSFIIMFVVGIIGELLAKFTPIPFSLIGLITGLVMLPAYSIPFFVGSLLGKYVFSKVFGDQWWSQYKFVIVAGISIGSGIVVAICAAIVMILKATWIFPF